MTQAQQVLQQVHQLTNLIRSFILTLIGGELSSPLLCYNNSILSKGSF